MTNYNVDLENFNLEKFLENKELPLLINNKFVIINIEKYSENVALKNMRNATNKERESINKYINSISTDTGINFFDN